MMKEDKKLQDLSLTVKQWREVYKLLSEITEEDSIDIYDFMFILEDYLEEL